jgi:methylmalonyl-CoA mutase
MVYRCVTASSLFDGHDAAINVMRRLLQKTGMEVIHLGHNRSVKEIVTTAIQEDADAICVSSYQGGHMEYFKYMIDQLKEAGAEHIRVFGGGGGTILPSEIDALQEYGVAHLYHAEQGRQLGLEGVISDLRSRIEPQHPDQKELQGIMEKGGPLTDRELGRALTGLEADNLPVAIPAPPEVKVVGITGPGGAGKSSLVDELITRYLYTFPEGRIGVLAFDPTKRKTGGALLGDRIRMNSIYNERVFLRSMATRDSAIEMSAVVRDAISLMKHGGFDLIILETSGIGQGSSGVVDLCDVCLYAMTSEYGASTQLEKIDMIDFADVIVVNKFDKLGAEDALDDVRHAYAHSRGKSMADRESFPIFGTTASSFNDDGVTRLFVHLMKQLQLDPSHVKEMSHADVFTIIPPHRTNYLTEIAEACRAYKDATVEKSGLATKLYQVTSLEEEIENSDALKEEIQNALGGEAREAISEYFKLQEAYKKEIFKYSVRGKQIIRQLRSKSLSDLNISRIALPKFHDWGDILRFMRQENLPGYFPYTAGVFPLRQEGEDPKRQFAGEGAPERTNKRFHYLCNGDDAKRLSTAFDSVTLYGEDPAPRMDIYGKVGNSGVSIATLDHMKALYKDFDLVAPKTSVSLTINGPAPMILAMFLNTAIDFEVEKQTGKPREECPQEEYKKIRADVLHVVRGTVQADILKEEQAQNTCIFSSKFALKMMGDIQQYFGDNDIKNFYSVSVSGYHIAEAGANPISQLAFTLSNGFTLLEYYLSRGMPIDKVAPSLSFFFSMGMDPEYAVIGRVARRIWAVAIRDKYGGDARSQKLKYHVQTSGRSLHAQEIAFNDIRTTLQALIATYDNCNSLHTNAYDEAVTTPTEESVRRAMAIQMIINKEYGVTKCENAMQGSFFYDELTDLVEEAVLAEFDSLSRRGGVLGAMEKQYQRHKIQTESMKYEMQKSSGELPIIGVNTYVGEEKFDYEHMEVIRATEEEKQHQINTTKYFIDGAGEKNQQALDRLQQVALSGGNIFEELMETVKVASLGQISHVLYRCGGEYRRSM